MSVVEFQVRNYAQEIDELAQSGVISSEEQAWMQEVVSIFRIPPEKLVNRRHWDIADLINALSSARLNMQLLVERWQLEAAHLDGGGKAAAQLPPPSYVGDVAVREAVRLGLLKPVLVWLGEVSEYGLRIGRTVYLEEDLRHALNVLAGCAVPNYPPVRLVGSVHATAKALAEPIPRGLVNPIDYLNFENCVVDLENLTVHQETQYLFTYRLPPVREDFVRNLREGSVDEAYFTSKPFYQVLRKHYSDEEWVKLKRVIGGILAPHSLRLIALIVGDKLTRKTFLFELLKSTLGSMVACIRLRDITENRFALSRAIGARALITSEEAQTVVRNVELLKSISGGDPLFVDRKFRPPVELQENPLKIIVFSNAIPVFRNYDEAFIDRLVIITSENPEPVTPQERELMSEAKKRKSEFMEFILYCYWELKSNRFQIPDKGSERYAQILLEAQSNVYQFVDELFDSGVSGHVARTVKGARTQGVKLYELYKEWCSHRGEEAESIREFYEHFTMAVKDRGIVRQHGSARTVVFLNIALRPAQQPDQPPQEFF